MAIDPGTGVSSPAGFVEFNAEGRIFTAKTITTKKKTANERLKEITSQIQEQMTGEADLICIENFYLRGLGGQTLQRMIGASIGVSPSKTPIQEVQNTTVKRIVGGTGKADKETVADGVYHWFAERDSESVGIIQRLICDEQWDILDAFAIGIAGYQLYTEEL